MMYSFRNDYNSVGCAEVLQCLIDNKDTQYVGYGMDEVTSELEKKFKELTKEDISLYLLVGGTQVNLVTISKILNDYEAVICADTGHINVHETGAVEATGHKILTVKNILGKINSKQIKEVFNKHIDCHMVKPRLVYISNTTEVGTYYTKEELISIYNTCKELDLLLFLDGARLSVALDASDLSLSDIAKYTDVFYFGGTKNGLPFGEALIVKNDWIKKDFAYHQKNKGAMLAKSYVVSLMFDRLLKDNLYLTLAKHSNYCASVIEAELKKNNYVIDPVQSNQIFITLNNDIVNKLLQYFDFEIWDTNGTESKIRLVTTFNTDISMCYEFVNILNQLQ